MFERFSHEARAVLVLAQEQARELGHNWVGTEHLLLGVAAQRTGKAAEALSEVGVDLSTLRRAVVETLGPGSTASGAGSLVDEDEVALRSVGIDMNVVRAKVEEVFGRGALDTPVPTARQTRRWLRRRRRGCRPAGARAPQRPFAPRAKKSLELARRESLALRHESARSMSCWGCFGCPTGWLPRFWCREGCASTTCGTESWLVSGGKRLDPAFWVCLRT